MSAVPASNDNAAFDLVGQVVADGWKITQRLPRKNEPGGEHLTGGHFSIGYIAVKGNKKAFVKAIDVQGVIDDRDSGMKLIPRLKRMTDSHSFESTILDVCKKAKVASP